MPKIQKSMYQWAWIITAIVAAALFVPWYYWSKNSSPQSPQSSARTQTVENAVAKVKMLPEVIHYLKMVPDGHVLVNGEEDNGYMVQVYEFKDGHTATFNWYSVDKTTGVIEKQF